IHSRPPKPPIKKSQPAKFQNRSNDLALVATGIGSVKPKIDMKRWRQEARLTKHTTRVSSRIVTKPGAERLIRLPESPCRSANWRFRSRTPKINRNKRQEVHMDHFSNGEGCGSPLRNGDRGSELRTPTTVLHAVGEIARA